MEAILTVDEQGSLSLPDDVRERNRLLPGTPVRLVEVGDGMILLARQPVDVVELANKIDQLLEEAGVSLDDLMEEGRKIRHELFQERYGDLT